MAARARARRAQRANILFRNIVLVPSRKVDERWLPNPTLGSAYLTLRLPRRTGLSVIGCLRIGERPVIAFLDLDRGVSSPRLAGHREVLGPLSGEHGVAGGTCPGSEKFRAHGSTYSLTSRDSLARMVLVAFRPAN